MLPCVTMASLLQDKDG